MRLSVPSGLVVQKSSFIPYRGFVPGRGQAPTFIGAYMSNHQFRVGQYSDQDSESLEWGVLHTGTRTWYFPEVDTQASAQELAERLNRID